VEVKPQGVSKGGVVERILLEAASSNTAHDVVVCIGDDRSDEDMYIAIEHVAVMPHMPAEVRFMKCLQVIHKIPRSETNM
jgi:trehalose 6-phosphate synthase/phosphatase